MHIYPRVVLILIVVLSPVITLIAGDHWRRLEADAGPIALTIAQRPEPRRAPEKSALAPDRDEQLSQWKVLAFLILMLKEGRAAQ